MITRKQLRTHQRLNPKAEPKPANLLHPLKRVPVSQAEWERIKDEVFKRSGGICEGLLADGRLCMAKIWRANFEAHHVIPRSRGGEDSPENLNALCHECHASIHGKPQWSKGNGA